MGQVGRKPKPTALKILGGNPGKRKINKNEPKPRSTSGAPMPRNTFGVYGRRFWRAIAPQLVELGLLTDIDLPAFEMMVMHYELAREAHQVIRAGGMFTVDERGMIRKHPAMQVQREQSLAFGRYATEFGIGASARARLMAGGDPEEEDLAEQLFRMVRDGELDE